MPTYLCPRCGGILRLNGDEWDLTCSARPCQYGVDAPRFLVPQADGKPLAIMPPARAARIGLFKAGYEKGFELFWVAYPRKTAKAVAVRAWNKIELTVELIQTILDAIAWQRESKQWAEDGIIPHPATWLNQRRWEDEPPTALVPANPTPKPPSLSFKEQDRNRARDLRRAGVRPGMPVPMQPRPMQRPLPLPVHSEAES